MGNTVSVSSSKWWSLCNPLSLRLYISRQVSLPFSLTEQMDPCKRYKAKAPLPVPQITLLFFPPFLCTIFIGFKSAVADVPCGCLGVSSCKNDNLDLVMVGSIPVCLKHRPIPNVFSNDQCGESTVLKSSHRRGYDLKLDMIDKGTTNSACNLDAMYAENFCQSWKYPNKGRTRLNLRSSYIREQDGSFLPIQAGQTCFSYATAAKNSSFSRDSKVQPFDICPRASWHVKSRVRRTGMEQGAEGTGEILLRSGMVLLKNYITHCEQVNIIKKCQLLGLGPGGFYQPSYQDGRKLRLQMMCLGQNWDPQTRRYEDRREVDGSKPPTIPYEFSKLVQRAIQSAHALIRHSGLNEVEDELPLMSPNICIVNFYTTSGKLGLHQDRDESRRSIENGVPVISFSIGDAAVFLYGDERDVDNANKLVLESGDVLIFGGESRLI